MKTLVDFVLYEELKSSSIIELRNVLAFAKKINRRVNRQVGFSFRKYFTRLWVMGAAALGVFVLVTLAPALTTPVIQFMIPVSIVSMIGLLSTLLLRTPERETCWATLAAMLAAYSLFVPVLRAGRLDFGLAFALIYGVSLMIVANTGGLAIVLQAWWRRPAKRIWFI